MKDQPGHLDDFFHNVSRFIIFVPITVVILAVLLKFNGSISQQKGFRDYNASPTPVKLQNLLESLTNPKKSTASAKFNLAGPLSCAYATESVKVNAYVKDKKIYIKMGEKSAVSNYLLNDDCVYIWKGGMYSGEKICGLSQQVNIAEGLLSSGLIDPNLIFQNLGKVFDLPDIGGSQDVLKIAMSSCKNEELPETVKFDIPKNVLFKNKVLQ